MDLVLALKAIIMGIVEGLTEFLPISSTGHLILAGSLLNFTGEKMKVFEIVIQAGAIIAVCWEYRARIAIVLAGMFSDAKAQKLILNLFVAFLPAAVVGLLLRQWIKSVLFASPAIIAASFIIGGLILILIEYRPPRVTTHEAKESSLKQALIIGIAQVVALVPGASRSGASIVGGMLAGLDRRAATTFSFYLAIPTLGAATIVDLLGSLDTIAPHDGVYLLLGTLVSLVVAWLSIDWLLRFVAHHTFVGFGIYRIVVGLLILALISTGWLL